MNMLAAASLTNLLYLDVWRVLWLSTQPTSFFLVVTPANYAAAILVVVVGGAALGAVATLVRDSHPVARKVVDCAFLLTIVVLLDSMRKHNGVLLPQMVRDESLVIHALGRAGIAVLAGVLVVVVVWYSALLARAYRGIVLILSPFLAYTLGRTLHVAVTTDFAAFADSTTTRPAALGAARARVVFIVFDEMDNEVAFSRRPSDLQLPNFDQLRRESVVFDSAFSPAANTAESMPSYLLGVRVAHLVPTGPRSFVAVLGGGERLGSDTAATLLSRLTSHGARAAVAGFALPYCRLPFASALQDCYWLPIITGGSITGLRTNVLAAAVDQVRSFDPFNNRYVHMQRLRGVRGRAERFVADSGLDFVFLHFPVPHLPPIYDRRRSRFRATGFSLSGYLDNLALADATLGDLRAHMVAAGQWDRSTVIVTSDHPWRNKGDLYPNETDTRIPLFVKLPSESAAVHVQSAVNSILVHDLVLDLLSGHPTLADTGALRRRYDAR